MTQSSKLNALLGELEWKAFNELNDVSDYIWKSPRFLEQEQDSERRKMAAYFPNGGTTAEIRRHRESVKLNETFPRLIAVANLFVALSTFENHVLLLLKVLQENVKSVPKQAMGRGVIDHLKAMRAYGIDPDRLKHDEQVRVAVSIRNCLMHANGLLTTFTKAEALKSQVEQQKFLSSDVRKRQRERTESGIGHIVAVDASELGDQLVITNAYSHTVCSYLRDYFCALCGSLNQDTALRPQVIYMDPRDLMTEPPHEGPVM